MDTCKQYYDTIIAAFIRGSLTFKSHQELEGDIFKKALDELDEFEINDLVVLGKEKGLRLHKFKRSMELPRVRKVLGIIKGLQPSSLLDIGSGRGNFLWPLLDAFPYLDITATDIDEMRTNGINAVQRGGFCNLKAEVIDATSISFGNNSFDVVTALEVLEHIQSWPQALNEVVRVASRFVIISVPSKEDDNPEHLNLINQDMISDKLHEAGIRKVNFEYVPNHMIVIAEK